jgi:tetratricopeptide (TPR) repeat protein
MNASVPELERRLLQATRDGERLDTLLELAREHSAAFRNREGLRAAREALEIARRQGDKLAEGQALAAATLCHYQRGDPLAAIATGLDAVEAYADGDVLGRSRALQSIALALFSVEAFELAETMAERSVADARAGNDPEREAYASNVFGVILADRGRFNAARRNFRAAAAFYRADGDTQRLKKTTSNLGHTYRKQGIAQERDGRFAHARMYWTQALRVYRIALATARHEAHDAIILGAMAECECRLGDLAPAQAHVTQALALAGKVDDPAILAHCHLWKGHIHKAAGDLEAAQDEFERACAVATPLEHDEILGSCLAALAALLDARGNTSRAAQVEARARKSAANRVASLARIREQLGPLWNRLINSHA